MIPPLTSNAPYSAYIAPALAPINHVQSLLIPPLTPHASIIPSLAPISPALAPVALTPTLMTDILAPGAPPQADMAANMAPARMAPVPVDPPGVYDSNSWFYYSRLHQDRVGTHMVWKYVFREHVVQGCIVWF